MNSYNPFVRQLDVTCKVQVMIRISLFGSRCYRGGLMFSVIMSRLPPSYSAFLQIDHFTPGSLFYISSNEAQTAPLTTMNNGNNFFQVKCHDAMLAGAGEGEKDK